MFSTKASRIAAIYDERSSNYDDSFHPRQAADFIKWAELQPGQNALDLCCGTGLVTLLAKQAVGENGRVIGVDVSSQMLDEARRKARKEGLEVIFINGDVTDLNGQKAFEHGQLFDLITCASAFVMLQDPVSVLRYWGTLLTPTGKLIIDVPTEKSMVIGTLLERLLREEGMASGVLYGRHGVTSRDLLRDTISEAGLVALNVFETDLYGTAQSFAKDARAQFDKWINYTENGDIADPSLREKLVGRFQELMNEAANSDGVVADDIRFNMAVARR